MSAALKNEIKFQKWNRALQILRRGGSFLKWKMEETNWRFEWYEKVFMTSSLCIWCISKERCGPGLAGSSDSFRLFDVVDKVEMFSVPWTWAEIELVEPRRSDETNRTNRTNNIVFPFFNV